MTLTILKVTTIIPNFLRNERTLESLSKDVFTPRTSSWRGRFAFLGDELVHIFVQMVCMRVKILSKTNLVASYRHIKMKKGALLVGVHRPKTSLLQFLQGWVAPYLCSLYMAVSPAGHLAGFLKTLSPNGPFPSNSFFRPKYLQSSHYSN